MRWMKYRSWALCSSLCNGLSVINIYVLFYPGIIIVVQDVCEHIK